MNLLRYVDSRQGMVPALGSQITSVLSDSDYRCAITASINPQELVGFLKEKGLLEESLMSNRLRKDNAEHLLRSVEKKGGNALEDFVWCLEQTSDSHLGHKYVVDLLRNGMHDLETLGEIGTSVVLKSKFQERSTKELMIDGVDVHSISPHLLKNKLITDKEMDELMKSTTRKRRFIKLESILANKGPCAYLYFTQALIDAKKENPLHEEILEKILGPPDDSIQNVLRRLYQNCD